MFQTNLPGTSIHVIDEYNQSVYDSSQFGTTESVLIIGTAFDGPVGKEVAVYNPEHANYIFGGSYDATTKRSATLTAHVQDAYDKGCRTIYCMRVGGKELSKMYRLKGASPLYFKMSSAFPSNKYKDMAMIISNGELHILKTANKATIEEKRNGAVQSNESIVKVTIDLNNDFGINANSSMSDLIEHLNSLVANNVFHFALVDSQGADMTFDDAASAIKVGSLFDGLYTVGRINKDDSVQSTLITTSASSIGVELDVTSNNDVESMYPYITADGYYAQFESFGGLEAFSQKDAVDYEELTVDNFELYKKLGSGFAQTAMLHEHNGQYIVKPTPKTDPRYTVEIGEGVYTTASNLKTDYRILTCAHADDTINGKRPKRTDFVRNSLSKIPVLKASLDDKEVDDALYATYKLDDDTTNKYGFMVKAATLEEENAAQTLTPSTVMANWDTTFYTLDTIQSLADKYALVEAEGAYWIGYDGAIVMSYQELFETEKDFITTIKKVDFEQSLEVGAGLPDFLYHVKTLEGYEEYTALSHFAEEFNASAMGERFYFVATTGFENEVPQLDASLALGDVLYHANRTVGADPHLVIPYTTNDNFARQLAQHCEYTSLKTYQTHGVIGVKPLNDTSIRSVTQKCLELVNKDFDLYVKSAIGRPVLGVDNMPYHIGKAITITTIQHTINTLDGYRFTASGESAYVGRASTLPASTSTTNQILAVAPHFIFSESQKAMLKTAGFVTITSKDGVYKIVDGVTQAQTYSQFSRFATFRTIKLVDRIIREATEPFIGKKNHITNRNSMYTAIKSGMDALLDEHLDAYEFTLDYNKQEARLGNINISYSVDIIDEIQNVKNTVTAKS